jgi:hypothetical protein
MVTYVAQELGFKGQIEKKENEELIEINQLHN